MKFFNKHLQLLPKQNGNLFENIFRSGIKVNINKIVIKIL